MNTIRPPYLGVANFSILMVEKPRQD